MNLKFLIGYIKRSALIISELKHNGGGDLSFFIDFIWSSLRYGCLVRHYVYGEFYRLSRYDRKASLTYRRILEFYRRCNQNDYIHILENKQDFNAYFKPFVKRKWLYTSDMTYEDFVVFSENNVEAIVKPLLLCEGEGVHKIEIAQDENSRKAQYLELKQTEALVEEFIIQNKRMCFDVKSVNTIRMHTLLTNAGEVICFKPMLRVGVGDAVIDNYCAGGSVYEVDVEDGVVIGVSLSKDHKKHKVHPGTNIMMLGYQIPNWDQVISGVKKAAKMLPQCRFIGWDVAITDDGIELIEGNHNPDYELLEFQGTRGWYGKLKNYL